MRANFPLPFPSFEQFCYVTESRQRKQVSTGPEPAYRHEILVKLKERGLLFSQLRTDDQWRKTNTVGSFTQVEIRFES